MGRRKNFTAYNNNFNQYLNWWFLNLSVEQKRFLSPAELLKVQPGHRLNAFCTDASLEEKIVLFSKTGGEVALKFSPKKLPVKGIEKEAKFSDVESNVSKLVDNKTFVLGSAPLLIGTYYLSQSCQTDEYVLNRNFQRIYMMWQMVGNNLKKSILENDFKEIEQGHNYLIEVIFKMVKNLGYYAHIGLRTQMDFTVLVHLMRKTRKNDYKNHFTEKKLIFNECNDGTWKLQTLAKCLNWLYSNRYIMKDKESYCIQDKGIMVVEEYMKRMTELINFDI